MLNSIIMRQAFILIIVLLAFLVGFPVQASQYGQRVGGTPTPTVTDTPTITPTPIPAVRILVPHPGQALQGVVLIQGSTGREDFSYAVLEFNYLHRPGEAWFPMAEIVQPVVDGLLYEWDTTLVTDGDYTLRLVVFHVNSEAETVALGSVRIRNYSFIETDTPTPITPTATLEPGETPAPTQTPTATVTEVPPTGTSLPLNPARLYPNQVIQGIGQGALLVSGLFALGGLYILIRNLRRK
jgi:hypothetical protein